MICNFIRTTLPQLEAYLQDSSKLAQDINDHAKAVMADMDAYLKSRMNQSKGLSRPENLQHTFYDIDKAWDGIIFLLTGSNSSDTSQPLARIIFSGQLVDPAQDLGTGPAHYLLPQQVKDLNDQIRGIVPASLKERYNPAAMKELGVYPNAWDHEDAADYLIEYFETVQEIFALAAQRDEALITFIS